MEITSENTYFRFVNQAYSKIFFYPETFSLILNTSLWWTTELFTENYFRVPGLWGHAALCKLNKNNTNKQTNKQISKYNWGNPFNGKISYFSLYEETISLHVSNQWSSTEKALEIKWHRWRAHIFSKPYDLAFDSIYNPQSAFRLTTKVLNSDKMVLWSFGNTVKRTITTI